MKREKKNSRGEEAWGQPLCYLGLFYIPLNAPEYIRAKPISSRA
jgi:hypothetical protein